MDLSINIKISDRLQSIDALRGLAVILMITQHLIAWLWNEPVISQDVLFQKSFILGWMYLSGLLAAPVFISLSGFGAVLQFNKSRQYSVIIKRGIILIIAGYLLNLSAFHWFKPASWFVLNLIGFSLILFPLLNKLGSAMLISFYFATLIIAGFLQGAVNSPLILDDFFLSNAGNLFDVMRLIFINGHFPVFPWIGIFALGMFSAKIHLSANRKLQGITGLLLIILGLALGIMYKSGYAFATYGPFYRFFVTLPYFFPPMPPAILVLSGLSILLINMFYYFNNKMINLFQPVSNLGRISFTVFVVHIMIFEEMSMLLGFYKVFDSNFTILAISLTLFSLIILAHEWKKIDFKYGLEYIIKKL